MLITGLCFMACNNDDDKVKGDGPADTEEPVFSDVLVLTDRLVTFDEAGEVAGINYGTELNHNAAPGIYSIQADDIEAAKAIFMDIVEGFTNITTSGDDIAVTLYDSDSTPEGKVLFNKGDGSIVATMTFDGFEIPGVSELRFLKKFPTLNAQSSPWRLYDIVTVPSEREGRPRGICIREYKNGQNGMIICPTSYECGYQNWRTNSCLETMKNMAKQVKALGVDNVKARLQQAGLYSDLTRYYWSDTMKFYFFDMGHWKVRLSDGDDIYVSSWEVGLSVNNANNAYTYYFDGNGRCW